MKAAKISYVLYPLLLINNYFKQDSNQWTEALRVCKEYLPHKLSALQDEYDRTVLSRGSQDVETLLNQAQQWEEAGEYNRAVDCYTKVGRIHFSW